MPRITSCLILGAALLFVIPQSSNAGGSFGSAFGALGSAQTIGQGKGNFGLGVGIADATSFFGSFTYGMGKYTDGRLRLGLVDADGGDTEIAFGADFKWHFWEAEVGRKDPLDMAVGGLFEYVDFGGASVMQFGTHLTGSYPFKMKNGSLISPYSRLNVRLESVSFDLPAGAQGDDSDSNLEFGICFGTAIEFSNAITAFGEFQLDGNDGLFLGIDFNVM